MKTSAEKSNPGPQSRAGSQPKASAGNPGVDFADQRQTTPAYPELQSAIHEGPLGVAQRKQLEGNFGVTAQRQAADAPPNNTGLPDGLKSGIEGLSGLSLDDVRVHYNSPKPAGLQALAYTQGTEIHVAPGQERHLPHEAWHVVQQKQGRVKPTIELNGTPVNADRSLESEADTMGARGRSHTPRASVQRRITPAPLAYQRKTVQRQKKIGFEMEDADWRSWKKTWGIKAPFWKSPTDYKNCRPMTKRELLHQGADFKLEADEFVEGGNLLSDIEFVTEPFPLTSAGQGRLRTALDGIGAIYDTIIPLRGRDHRLGEFIRSNESHFSAGSAMLSKGAARAKLKIQATQGFNLRDIPQAFRALTQPHAQALPDGERAVSDAFFVLQHAVVGEADASSMLTLEPLKSAPDRAWHIALTYINTHLVGDDFDLTEDEQADLFGFVTAVVGFVRMMRNPIMIQGGAKTFTPMMHRNDFSTMFELLSDRLKTLLRANRQVFIDGIIAGAVADIEAEDPLEGYDPVAHRAEHLFRKFVLETDDRRRFIEPAQELELPAFAGGRSIAYHVLPPSFTVQRWVTAWMDAEDPKDLLTKAHFELALHNDIDPDPVLNDNVLAVKNALDPEIAALIDWGRSRFEGGMVYVVFKYQALSAAQKEILVDYIRGLGGLGDETDVDDNNLVLYENRNIAPDYTDLQGQPIDPGGGGKLGMPSARQTVLDYFQAMRELFGPPKG